VNRDILPERTWGAVNSQVPSKVFGGEGPQLAWGEESAKRSGRVCAAAAGRERSDASMMAELIVTKKEIVPQLKGSTGTSRARPKSPRHGRSTIAAGGKTLGRAFYSLVPGFVGRSWRRGLLTQFGHWLKERSGRTRRRGHG